MIYGRCDSEADQAGRQLGSGLDRTCLMFGYRRAQIGPNGQTWQLPGLLVECIGSSFLLSNGSGPVGIRLTAVSTISSQQIVKNVAQKHRIKLRMRESIANSDLIESTNVHIDPGPDETVLTGNLRQAGRAERDSLLGTKYADVPLKRKSECEQRRAKIYQVSSMN